MIVTQMTSLFSKDKSKSIAGSWVEKLAYPWEFQFSKLTFMFQNKMHIIFVRHKDPFV